MPTQLSDDEFLMTCACGDRMQHVAWLIHDVDDGHPRHDTWLMMTSLDRRFGFFRRLWTAVRYVLRPRTLRYCGYSELVLYNDDVDRLAAWINGRRASRTEDSLGTAQRE